MLIQVGRGTQGPASTSTMEAYIEGLELAWGRDMPTRKQRRPAQLEYYACGYEFVASVPQIAHFVDERSQPARWTIDLIDVSCPQCGSPQVGGRQR
jgi:hypothetical protein